MNIVIGERGSGKTAYLINQAAEDDGYIVVSTRDEAYRVFDVAREMGKEIRFPITYGEIKAGGMGFRNKEMPIHIDNVERFLREIVSVAFLGGELTTIALDQDWGNTVIFLSKEQTIDG